MRNKFLKAVLLAGASMALASCGARVGNGEVGVRYHTWGSDRGVEPLPLMMGWYFTGPGTDIETFPTFFQTRNWTDDNKEQIKFSDKDGLGITAEIGITYSFDPNKAPNLYKSYRRGADEIMDTFIHNMVRDGLIEQASTMPVEEIYGPGRSRLIEAVQRAVAEKVGPQGIQISKVYWLGPPQVPENVKNAINAKTVAIQRAQQVENEVAQTKAEAQKEVAKAEGDAQALLTRANSQAKANAELASSLTPAFVEYQKVLKWDGHLPKVSGGSNMIQMPEPK